MKRKHKATAAAIRAKSYPSRSHVARDSTDNSRAERISGLRKKGQLERVKPTLFFSKAEGIKLLEGFSKSPAKSIAEYIEGLILGPKSYPSGRPARSSRTDNSTFWIEGKRCLEDLIMAQEASSDQEIADINARLQRFHTKNVKGHTYWYMSDGNSGHKYIGREDPVPACHEEIKSIQAKTLVRIKEMKACIIAPIGNHYIISLDKVAFNTRNQELIELKTLLELADKRN